MTKYVLMVIDMSGSIRSLIASRKDSGNWDFVFLGAGPDAWSESIPRIQYHITTHPKMCRIAIPCSGQWLRGASGQSVAADLRSELEEK